MRFLPHGRSLGRVAKGELSLVGSVRKVMLFLNPGENSRHP
jgi:hypothetical protein